MADIPEGAILLNIPVSSAPSFKINNVFVFAGVPRIMQAMFEACKEYLTFGAKTFSKSINAFASEDDIAELLLKTQKNCKEVEIGSYPFIKDRKLGTSLVFRSTNMELIKLAFNEVKQVLHTMEITIEEESN